MHTTTYLRAAITDHPAVRAVVDAAAANDLYRINLDLTGPYTGQTCDWRRGDGTPVDKSAVTYALSRGLLGALAGAETLPDGAHVSRMDLSESCLDEYVAHLCGSSAA